MLATGEGTTSGGADQAQREVAWEIAPLRAVALRTERAVNQRWQTLRAAVIGGAVLLGVIGSAAAMSLSGVSGMPSGMGFLAGVPAQQHTSEADAAQARDGVAEPTTQPPTADPGASVGTEDLADDQPAPAAAPAPPVTDPGRGTPSAEPAPAQPAPSAPAQPSPTPEQPAAAPDDDDDGGLLGDLLDLLLPGLLP